MASLKDIFHAKRRFPHINLVKTILIVSTLTIAFSVFYYLVIFLPEKERARIEWERESATEEAAREAAAESLKDTMLDACLTDAQTNYETRWNKSCKNQGLSKDCQLSIDLANSYDKDLQTEKSNCFKRYQ